MVRGWGIKPEGLKTRLRQSYFAVDKLEACLTLGTQASLPASFLWCSSPAFQIEMRGKGKSGVLPIPPLESGGYGGALPELEEIADRDVRGHSLE
ncbi:MAG: hypothetical protein JXR56_03995 [Candidatus Cloacimonetes bacterium]|nr:hypothetical protein [Candidatus Cloacimonadota bacterium]